LFCARPKVSSDWRKNYQSIKNNHIIAHYEYDLIQNLNIYVNLFPKILDEMVEYAPSAYRALNGIFCVYKPTGRSIQQVIHALRTNLSRGTVAPKLGTEEAYYLNMPNTRLRVRYDTLRSIDTVFA